MTSQDCKYGYPIYWLDGEVIGTRCQGVKRSQMDTCESILKKGLCREAKDSLERFLK